MTGGHWNYAGQRIQDQLHDIGNDEAVKRRFPVLAESICRLGDALYHIEHELDWDICSDSVIEVDEGFQEKALGMLLDAVVRAGVIAQEDVYNRLQAVRAGRNQLESLIEQLAENSANPQPSEKREDAEFLPNRPRDPDVVPVDTRDAVAPESLDVPDAPSRQSDRDRT